MATKLNDLEDLFIDTLKDLYSAENQIVSSLPKMAKAANSPDLKQGLEQHLDQTKLQIERLEQIFANHEDSLRGKKCVGMEGILKEGEELMKEKIAPDVLDAGIIAAAQKVEHYEIASYGTARTFAQMLGWNEAAKLLQRTLNEEAATDEKLTALAESHINRSAQ